MPTKQDFENTAALLRKAKADIRKGELEATIDALTLRFADMFAGQSSRFDMDRFLKAAGLYD